jgi:hypothetical protein
VHEVERAEAIKTKATVAVRGSQYNYRVDNVESNAVIAEGFVAKASAERYSKVIRDQQERFQQTRSL